MHRLGVLQSCLPVMHAVTPHYPVEITRRVDAVCVLTQYINPIVSNCHDSPGLRQSSHLSAQKARHNPAAKSQMLNPAVFQTSQKALTCPMSERTI